MHHTWQIDGKEQVSIQNGKQVSWMSIADEGSTAHLKAIVQDCSKVNSICERTILQSINECFKVWGLPRCIKIDNGHPFVTPGNRDVPTKSKLWWIGLGIEVIQNRLYCPQQNGVVECLQGTLKRWSNPKDQQNTEILQKRLDQESFFQRNGYRIPAKGYKTRIELYPELLSNSRQYDPDKFDINLVYKFLSRQVWGRQINKGGVVSFMGAQIYISYKLKRLPVTITFDPFRKEWLIRTENGTLLKSSTDGVPTEKQIKDFATMSKNLYST